MDPKLMANMLVFSLAMNLLAVRIISDQEKSIERYKEYRRKMTNWSMIMSKSVVAHYAAGGTFELPEGIQYDIEAYNILNNNGLE